MKLKDAKFKRRAVRDQAKALLGKAEKENRDLTAEEASTLSDLKRQMDGLNTLVENLESLMTDDDDEGDVDNEDDLENDDEAEGGSGRSAPPKKPVTRTGGGGKSTSGRLPANRDDRLPDLTGKHKYSITRAIHQMASARELTGIEAEVSQELANLRGKAPQGFYIPINLPIERGKIDRQSWKSFNRENRALDTTAGAGAIPTILADNYIELLRARMVTYGLGATVMDDMHGNFAIPRQSGAGTMSWVAEGTAPPASNQTIDQVPFTPKSASCFTDYTRRFLEQSNIQADKFVINDLAIIIALGVESAAFNGTGAASYQPLGIFNNTAITPYVLNANGGAPTYQMAVQMEEIVANANADMGRLAYVTNAKVRSALKLTPKLGTTFPIFVWEKGEVNDNPAAVTTLIPSNFTAGTSGAVCSGIIFGNWENLVYAFWGGLDLLVDPYTGSSSRTTRVVAYHDADINVRHPQSFTYCNQIIAS